MWFCWRVGTCKQCCDASSMVTKWLAAHTRSSGWKHGCIMPFISCQGADGHQWPMCILMIVGEKINAIHSLHNLGNLSAYQVQVVELHPIRVWLGIVDWNLDPANFFRPFFNAILYDQRVPSHTSHSVRTLWSLKADGLLYRSQHTLRALHPSSKCKTKHKD